MRTTAPRLAFVKLGTLVGLVVILLVGGLSLELRDEGRRVGACAGSATTLSKVSDVVRQSLYPDTDHFLGSVPRLHEAALLESLKAAYLAAQRAATRCHASFLRTSAAEAREMFLAAMQERNLAQGPRGNWISYMSETAKAKTQFETAKARYELDRPTTMVQGDGAADVGAGVEVALAPFRRAVEETAAVLKKASDERARVEAEKRDSEGRRATYAREVERLEREEPAPPSRLADARDFEWKWVPDATGRSVLTFRNRTRWPIYEIYYGPVGRPSIGFVKRLLAGEETEARVGSTAGGRVVEFKGTFNPAR